MVAAVEYLTVDPVVQALGGLGVVKGLALVRRMIHILGFLLDGTVDQVVVVLDGVIGVAASRTSGVLGFLLSYLRRIIVIVGIRALVAGVGVGCAIFGRGFALSCRVGGVVELFLGDAIWLDVCALGSA